MYLPTNPHYASCCECITASILFLIFDSIISYYLFKYTKIKQVFACICFLVNLSLSFIKCACPLLCFVAFLYTSLQVPFELSFFILKMSFYFTHLCLHVSFLITHSKLCKPLCLCSTHLFLVWLFILFNCVIRR